MIASPSIGVDEELRAEFATFEQIQNLEQAPAESLLRRLVDRAMATETHRSDLDVRLQDLKAQLAAVETARAAAEQGDDFVTAGSAMSEALAIRRRLTVVEGELVMAIKVAEEATRQCASAWVLIENARAALTQWIEVGPSPDMPSDRRASFARRTLTGLLTPGAPVDPYLTQTNRLGQ